jgi:hypothetical protein
VLLVSTVVNATNVTETWGWQLFLAILTGLITLSGILLTAYLTARHERRRIGRERSQGTADLLARAIEAPIRTLTLYDSQLLASNLNGMADPALRLPLLDWISSNLGIEFRDVALLSETVLRTAFMDFYWNVNGFVFTNGVARPADRMRYEARLLALYGSQLRDALFAYARGEDWAEPESIAVSLRGSLSRNDAAEPGLAETVPRPPDSSLR